MVFHEKMRSVRKHLGLTQGELAEIAGVGKSAIAKLEGGHNALPSGQLLTALANDERFSKYLLWMLSESNQTVDQIALGESEAPHLIPDDVMSALAMMGSMGWFELKKGATLELMTDIICKEVEQTTDTTSDNEKESIQI